MTLEKRIDILKDQIEVQKRIAYTCYKNPKRLIDDIEYDEEILSYLIELKNLRDLVKSCIITELKGIKAEIHEAGILDHYSDDVNVALAYGKAEAIIDCKIKEVEHGKKQI